MDVIELREDSQFPGLAYIDNLSNFCLTPTGWKNGQHVFGKSKRLILVF